MLMRIAVLGGDSDLCWPKAMHFSRRRHEVLVVASFVRRQLGIGRLIPSRTLQEHLRAWQEASGRQIQAADQ